MAKKKLALDDFKKNELGAAMQRELKGGYKFSPSGPNFSGSFIWEGIDIRGPQIQNYERDEIVSGKRIGN